MRYHIRIQRRCEYNGLYERNDWRAYREWLVWPKTFHSAYEAQKFMDNCFTFKGLRGSKLSASVCPCNPKPTKKDYGAPGRAQHAQELTYEDLKFRLEYMEGKYGAINWDAQ